MSTQRVVTFPTNIEDPQKTARNPFLRLLRLRAGGAVKRYHTFPTLKEQRVDSHSHAVAVWLMSFHPDPSFNLIKAALNHDLAEYDTGDCPANVKWAYPAMDAMLKLAEAHVEDVLSIGSDLTTDEERWLKLADTMEYCMFSLDERRMGNMNMDIVFARGMKRMTQEPYVSIIDSHPKVSVFLNDLRLAYQQAKSGISPESVNITHTKGM